MFIFSGDIFYSTGRSVMGRLVIGMITIVKGHLFSDGTFSDGMITILKGHLVMGRLEMG